MRIGDRVQVVDKPISLLKQHAGIKAEIVNRMPGNKWLIRIGNELWWAKGYDLEVIVDE
jgi:hypothetical protein